MDYNLEITVSAEKVTKNKESRFGPSADSLRVFVFGLRHEKAKVFLYKLNVPDMIQTRSIFGEDFRPDDDSGRTFFWKGHGYCAKFYIHENRLKHGSVIKVRSQYNGKQLGPESYVLYNPTALQQRVVSRETLLKELLKHRQNQDHEVDTSHFRPGM